MSLCVPSTAGKSVTSGACSASGTTVKLPTRAADQRTLFSILPHLSFVSAGVGGKPTIRFRGVNVQVVNGVGATASVNGTGNLVVGYDENPAGRPQTGSHDLIVGRNQSFTGYGELLGGFGNKTSGSYAAALGNSNNAAGAFAAVTGGADNSAKDPFSSIGGGCGNLILATATTAPEFTLCDSASGGEMESITGGENNLATGTMGVVTGGALNTANGPQATVTGGSANTASGGASSVSGGVLNTASGNQAAISGGNSNIASGGSSSVSGGRANDTTDAYGSILGGCSNQTGGDTNPNNFTCIAGDGPANTVSGGSDNTSKGQLDSMLGGFNRLIQASAADSQIGSMFFTP